MRRDIAESSIILSVVWFVFARLFFFFSSRRRHTRCLSDWSSDVCSSDLVLCAPWLRTHFVYYQRFLSCFALGLLIPTCVGAEVAKRLPAMAWPAVLVGMLASRHTMGLHWWSMD